ncbi:MAG: hypothetical protein AMK70_02575 [Nitrospira bacterium SG8_35_1]|nr:MAG: hypothetical protein AMK70_02575 [Nitrospira bacterium SG8_35_1]
MVIPKGFCKVYWSTGVLEYCKFAMLSDGYSITPLLQYSPIITKNKCFFQKIKLIRGSPG